MLSYTYAIFTLQYKYLRENNMNKFQISALALLALISTALSANITFVQFTPNPPGLTSDIQEAIAQNGRLLPGQLTSIDGQGKQSFTSISLEKNTSYTLRNAAVSLSNNRDCFLDIDFKINQQGELDQKSVEITPPQNGDYSCTSQKNYSFSLTGTNAYQILFNFKLK